MSGTRAIADTRVHGTTHEIPLDRLERGPAHLLPTHRRPRFHTNAKVSRIIARDWLVSFRTKPYSVPFRQIGQAVEVRVTTPIPRFERMRYSSYPMAGRASIRHIERQRSCDLCFLSIRALYVFDALI